MAKFFIEHPVLANVLAIVLVLIGAVAVYNLPVAQIRTSCRRPSRSRRGIPARARRP